MQRVKKWRCARGIHAVFNRSVVRLQLEVRMWLCRPAWGGTPSIYSIDRFYYIIVIWCLNGPNIKAPRFLWSAKFCRPDNNQSFKTPFNVLRAVQPKNKTKTLSHRSYISVGDRWTHLFTPQNLWREIYIAEVLSNHSPHGHVMFMCYCETHKQNIWYSSM